MTSFGRSVAPLGTGRPLEVSADGQPIPKIGGITIDWSTVTAVSADTTLLDGVVIPNGAKGLRLGQVMTAIGVAEVQTVAVTSAADGTMVLTLPASGAQPAQSTPALAFLSGAVPTAAAVQAALVALSRIGPNGCTVTLSSTTYTITFNRRLGNVPQLTSTFTGTGNSAVHNTTTQGTATASGGQYGPYDSGASDGRQTLSRGSCFILNESILEKGLLGTFTPNTQNPQVIEGGVLWKERMLMTTGTHSLAAGPTVTEVEAAFPLASWIST